MTRDILREVLISEILRANRKFDRSELEGLANSALIELASKEVSSLASLSPDWFKVKIDDSRARSSAPYSSGSSDKAMMSG
jgi:hypothetical protein